MGKPGKFGSREFPNLVVSNLVVCNLYVEALFCTLLCSFALICGLAFAVFRAHLRSFALICVFLHPTVFRTTAFGNCRGRGLFPLPSKCSEFRGEFRGHISEKKIGNLRLNFRVLFWKLCSAEGRPFAL